jgi:chemotaxis protein methyltransferase CheR
VNAFPSRAELEAFRDAVSARLGLRFDDDKLEHLADVAAQRRDALREPRFDRYVARVASGADAAELRALAEHLTVGESYFFRNEADLDAFARAVVPDLMRARARERRLRILSAACASGEEPYTLAMIVRQLSGLASWDVAIRAFDVNPAALSRAAAARYGPWSLRQTTPDIVARFFSPEGRDFRLDERVRAMVSFEERNLVDPDPEFWRPGAFDVVFCRNVTMYFAPETTRRVIARIASALVPGGYLFLGHAETLRGISTDFHLCEGEGTFYYQRRGGGEAPPEPRDGGGARPSLARCVPAPDGTWMDAIRRASERIAALTAPAAPPAARDAAAPATPLAAALAPAAGLGGVPRALELLHEERHDEALAALGDDAAGDALLLRAVLLATRGDAAGAEVLCRRILEADELDAEAHYVLALCREHAGDRAGAARHDAYALYLDPSFAMPRLHLGLLARRAGDAAAARRELSRALVLLACEDGSRLLLLGGGFSREALADLCRAELRACGGSA